MTVRLTVRRPAWRSHIAQFAASVDGLIPVVKGNGYGFGRTVLHHVAADLADSVCVGSVHELGDVPQQLTPVVLTPVTERPPDGVVVTVGSLADVDVLDGWNGQVIIKLASSMRRFGVTAAELSTLQHAVGDRILAYGIHLRLAGDDAERVAEINQWLAMLPDSVPLWVSHLTPTTFANLQAANRSRTLRLRVGTALWHGNKSMLHLSADTIATSAANAGDQVGYRGSRLDTDGTIVVVGAGSAHGVTPLADGGSPFHFARTRLPLIEAPHMHASMLLASSATAQPRRGDWVDLQRPLISTNVDVIEWID